MKRMSIESDVGNQHFDELARAYGRGRLTPFTGSGLSVPASPTWLRLIEDLEGAAGLRDGAGTASADLIRRAARAVQALRLASPSALGDAVRSSMYRGERPVGGGLTLPPQTEALAGIWWPLVLTTNYEALFLGAWNRRWADGNPLPDSTRMVPVGRGRTDCQRVLNALRAPDNPLLWALQGFVGTEGGALHPLADQLAIGHEEYRRYTHEAVHFRRAFAEVYRSRVLLFLGSGLQETYFQDLFGEALELLGTIDHFHYAFVPAGRVDVDFLLRRFQIRAIEYTVTPDQDAKAHVVRFLTGLRGAIDAPRPRTATWGLRVAAPARDEHPHGPADLSVVRGPLPAPDPGDRGTATVLSAGINWTKKDGPEKPRLLLGRPGQDILAALPGVKAAERKDFRRIGTYVWRVGDLPIYIVAARDMAGAGRDARDARHVAPATGEVLRLAAANGATRIDSMLLSAGPYRTFPQHVALAGMARGYGTWFHGTLGARAGLTIHLVDPAVLGLLDAGRIDLLAMLDPREVRFWIEIDIGTASPAPFLDVAPWTTPLATIIERHAIPKAGWEVSVRPVPTRRHAPVAVDALTDPPLTLEAFGLFPGSTLVFRRR